MNKLMIRLTHPDKETLEKIRNEVMKFITFDLENILGNEIYEELLIGNFYEK